MRINTAVDMPFIRDEEEHELADVSFVEYYVNSRQDATCSSYVSEDSNMSEQPVRNGLSVKPCFATTLCNAARVRHRVDCLTCQYRQFRQRVVIRCQMGITEKRNPFASGGIGDMFRQVKSEEDAPHSVVNC